MNNAAIILGAGSGTRMKIEKSKLLLELDGIPVIMHSVNTFLDIEDVHTVIVTVREQDIKAFSDCISDERVRLVIGGATRQESVKKAFDTIDNADLVIIHDGARPLVKKQDILNAVACAADCGAAALGVAVKDTIKIVDGNGYVVNTPRRSSLFAVQTPQIFEYQKLKAAIHKAISDGKDFTDDCQLIEYSGGTVKIVQGSYDNIKITTPDDIVLAEKYLKSNGDLL